MAKADLCDAMEDPVVVVGMACRLPGDATSPESFWNMVSQARSASGKVPSNRFNASAYLHPNPDRHSSIITDHGYFMAQDPGAFDAPFFSMTAMEAAGMDPQQRLLLEVVYEGLENAGIPMNKLPKSKTSVYVGSFTHDYEAVSGRDLCDINPYQVTGVGNAMLSNRISWFFDLVGPSFTLDTACSSSMYGLHLGCQSLLTGESNMAICAGSNVILQPDLFRGLSAMRFLSPDGICHSFDARANGYARGEGFSVVVLKRLSSALADGDTIRAVIRASGVNQDGRTPGITMPSATAQAALIESCYEKAGLSYDDTAYFEAHGTGTLLGDPTEASALGATFGQTRDPSQPLWVSSAKTNIGHQEGGAGLAGVIRTVLALERGEIPPLAGLETPNPRLKLDEWKVALPTAIMPWPRSGLRRASVNSFGYGGANAHAILDDAHHYLASRGIRARHATHTESDADDDSDSGFSSSWSLPTTPGMPVDTKFKQYQVFPYSALDEAALQRTFAAHAKYLQDQVDGAKQLDARACDLTKLAQDLAFTLSDRRTTFDRRSYVVADSVSSLVSQLRDSPPATHKVSKTDHIIFVFTGQGAQHCQQGQGLLQHAVFRASLTTSQETLQDAGCSWDLFEEMLKPKEESLIDQPAYSQPLCTALQLAQVDLLASWGVTPKAVIGHSSGEIAAAYAYGALSHRDAMRIAYHRGTLSAAVSARQPGRPGAMMAVALSPEAVETYLKDVESMSVVVACVNSPESVTLSGDAAPIASLETRFQADGIFARKLKVQTAYHSPHMHVIADDYLSAIGDMNIQTPKSEVLMFSSVTSSLVNAEDLGPSYWVANMLRPVRFDGALQSLISYSTKSRGRRKVTVQYRAAIELGPHEALRGPIRQMFSSMDKKLVANVQYGSMMCRGKDAAATALEVVGKLWSLGCSIDLTKINSGNTPRSLLTGLVDLPPYAWNHAKSFWHEAHAEKARRQLAEPRTDLLGTTYDHHNPMEPRWRNVIRVAENPWLLDHKVQDALVLPGAAMLVSALEAAQKVAEPGRPIKGFRFRDVQIKRGLMLPAQAQHKLDVAIHVNPHRLGTRSDSAPWFEFSYFSFPDETVWQSHCTGLFLIEYQSKANEIDEGKETSLDWEHKRTAYEELQPRLSTKYNTDAFYKYAESRGYQYGTMFRGIQECAFTDQGHWSGKTAVTDTKSVMPREFEFDHLLHPTTLDNFIQLPLGPLSLYDRSQESWVPTGIDEMYISANLPKGAGTQFVGFGSCQMHGDREAWSDMTISDESFSEAKIVMNGLRYMCIPSMSSVKSKADLDRQRKCVNLHWAERACKTGPSFDTLDVALVEDGETTARSNLHEHTIRKVVKALDLVDSSRTPENVQQIVRWTRITFCTPVQAATATDISPFSHGLELPEAKVFEGLPERLVVSMEEGKNPSEALTEDLVASLDQVRSQRLASSSARIAEWFDSAAIDKPDLSVLLLGDGGASCARDLAARFDQQFQKCVFAEPTSEALARSKGILQSKSAKLPLELVQLDVLEDAAPEGFETAFDLIVAPTLRNEKAINGMHRLLKPGGRLVLTGLKPAADPASFFHSLSRRWCDTVMPYAAEPDLESTTSAFEKLGFGQVAVHETSQSTMITGVASSNDDMTPPGQEIVFLTTETPPSHLAPLLENFQQRIQENGHTVTFATLDQKEKLIARNIVSFLDLCKNFLAEMDEHDFGLFQSTMGQASRILWLTQGANPLSDTNNPSQALASGLLRCLGVENEQMLCCHFDLSMQADLSSQHIHDLIYGVLDSTILPEAATREREYAERDGRIYVPRLLFDKSLEHELQMPFMRPQPTLESLVQSDRPLQLVVGVRGQLDSLRWTDPIDPDTQVLGPDDVELKNMAMSLNFLDVMAVMGHVVTDRLGVETAGIVTRVGSNVSRFRPGQHVVAMQEQGFHTSICQFQHFVQEVPEGMTPTVAATLPTVYMTAYAGLVESARLRKGETVLIHSAAGGVGQAAIQIAQWTGAEIYVTVGTKEKKELIMQAYGIPEDHIFSSRDSSFAAGIKRMTSGKGVDVILNSLPGELLRQTWLCVADFGRFVEIGKRDIMDNSSLEMNPFLRQVTFSSVNLDYLYKVNPKKYSALLEDTFSLIRSGAVGAIHPVTEYSFGDLEKALRSMQTGKHMGKIVVKVDDGDMVPVMPKPPGRYELDPKATYVLCGGLGGIGRSISRAMFDHGAGHIVFVSRSGANGKPEAEDFIARMRSQGKRVDAFACDTADPAAVHAFVADCQSRGWVIKGFMQCAMALRNRALAMMTWDDWSTTIKSKVPSTKHFHDALPKDLDFFITLASTSGILGAPSQGNYAAGNTYQDAFAHWRRSQGMAGTSLDLGVVSDVGYIAENGGVNNFDHFTGFEELHISENDIHLIISAALLGRTADGRPFPAQSIVGLGASLLENSVLGQPFLRNPKFAHLKANRDRSDTEAVGEALKAAIAASQSVSEAGSYVLEAIKEKVARAMSIEADDIDITRPLHSYGVDSLIAVEIRNWFFRELKAEVALFDLLSPTPLSTLSLKVASRSKLVSAEALAADLEQVKKEIESNTPAST